MANSGKDKTKKLYNSDSLTLQERQDRIVEILTEGVLRLIEKKQQKEIELQSQMEKTPEKRS